MFWILALCLYPLRPRSFDCNQIQFNFSMNCYKKHTVCVILVWRLGNQSPDLPVVLCCHPHHLNLHICETEMSFPALEEAPEGAYYWILASGGVAPSNLGIISDKHIWRETQKSRPRWRRLGPDAAARSGSRHRRRIFIQRWFITRVSSRTCLSLGSKPRLAEDTGSYTVSYFNILEKRILYFRALAFKKIGLQFWNLPWLAKIINNNPRHRNIHEHTDTRVNVLYLLF